ncbi:MAG TPA: SDR family oxidoreductase [Terracidiphilus sp.]|nr:SDR family oxidoreductase [Terracidiphilus sp.]
MTWHSSSDILLTLSAAGGQCQPQSGVLAQKCFYSTRNPSLYKEEGEKYLFGGLAKTRYAFFCVSIGFQPMTDTFRLENKFALVTGGASGIGAATVRELASAGAHVLIADLNLAAAQTLAAELPNARAVAMDVTDSASIASAFANIPQLDILINNAGIGLVGDITHTSEEDFARVMKVNVHSVFLVTQAAFPLLLASRGSIVNIGSVAATVGVKQRFAYCASKGAVLAMTRQIAVDYPKELRINCIAPGTVQTPFVEGYLDKYHAHEKEKVRAELVARQPIGRLGTPEDIASLVRYLCSREAEFINGALIPIDGGWTAA